MLYLFITLALISEILGTLGGFGSSMFFVPVASYFFDFHSVLGITALFHLSSNVSKIALFRKGFDKRLVLTIGIPAVLFVIAGAYLSNFVNTWLAMIILSAFLIVLSLLLMRYKTLQLPPTNLNSVTGGALSGLIAGLLGTGGAIRGLTLAAFNLDKERFISTSAIIDLGIDFSRSIVYFSNGYIHQHDYHLVPILLVVGVTGTFIGKKLLTRFSETQFRYVVLVLVLMTGFSTLIGNLRNH